MLVASFNLTSTTYAGFVNGTAGGSGTGTGQTYGSFLGLGRSGAGFSGTFSEFAIWQNQTSNRSGIEGNVNAHFQIGNFGTPTSGLLYDYSGAAAAYSVRQLANTAALAMRIREDGTDTETNIGFDSNGDLDTAAIASHCGANNGYVVTWYDQSGNQVDATQSTTANQPQIYDGTAVITDNGKPALQFSSDYFSLGDAVDATNGDISAYMAVNPSATTPLYGSYISKTKAADVAHRWEFSPNRSNYDALGSPNQITGYELNQQHLASFEGIGSVSLTAYQDGTQAATVSLVGKTELQGSDWYTLIGGYGDSSGVGGAYQTYIGTIQEIVCYTTDQRTNRTGIEGNINTYFSIY